MIKDYFTYEPNFLSPQEEQALFEACNKFPFARRQTIWKQDVRHQTVSFTERYSERLGYVGPHFDLKDAPPEMKALQTKLSTRAGKHIDYMAAVLYEDGRDHMGWHQHREDRYYDGTVYNVSTGTARVLGFREINRTGCDQQTTFIAEPGSLIIMSSEANDLCEHAVLPGDRRKTYSRRISINCKSVGPRVYCCRQGHFQPEGAVYVGRKYTDRKTGEIVFPETPFGNHYKLPQNEFRSYAQIMMQDDRDFAAQVMALRGKDLLCWCRGKELAHCHAMVWLEIANRVLVE